MQHKSALVGAVNRLHDAACIMAMIHSQCSSVKFALVAYLLLTCMLALLLALVSAVGPNGDMGTVP